MVHKIMTESEIKNAVFMAYLHKTQGKRLTTREKDLIATWEFLGKINKK